MTAELARDTPVFVNAGKSEFEVDCEHASENVGAV